MKKIIAYCLFMMLFGFAYSQIDRLHIYKLPDKQNKRTIKKEAYLEVGVRYYNKDSLKSEDLFEGKFLEVRNDSLIIDLERRITFVRFENGMLKQESLSKGFDTKPLPYIEEAVPLSEISMIRYRSKPAKVFRKIGTITFWTSFATIALVAPLASINYRQGTFNFDRYKTIIMAGGIGIGISIPMLVFSGRRRCIMQEGMQHLDKKRWTFDE
jgi:hypothetical protein